MKTAFSTLACQNASVEEIIAACKTYSIDGVELRLGPENQFAGASSLQDVERIAGQFEDAGITVVDLASSICLRGCEGGIPDNVAETIEYAKIMGAKGIRVFLGHFAAQVNPHLPAPDYEGITLQLQTLCDMAARKGREIWVETHNEFSTGKVLRQLLQDVNRENMMILWDVLHSIEDGELVEETWSLMGDRVVHVHVKDGYDRKDPLWHDYCHTCLGEGEVPLHSVLDLLKREGYEGFVSLEWERPWRAELKQYPDGPDWVLAHYRSFLDQYEASRKMKHIFVAIPEGDVKATFLPGHIRELLESKFLVTYNETGRQLTGQEMRAALADQDAVLTGWGNCMLNREVLEGNNRLKLIVHTGGTVGNLVDSYAYEHQIMVYSGNILYAESVAEGTLAYMLMAQRRIPAYMQRVKEGGWRTEADRWEGLLDKTVGIVGLSTISRILIPYLKLFRVKIKLFTHHAPDADFLAENQIVLASLDEIFESCDIVSVHSALNAENRKLIKREHFRKLKDNALFINTSRGAVIDEEALIEELKKNRFRAVLDVFEQEPLPSDSPLRSLANVCTIPHMGGPTLDRREYIAKALIEEAEQFFAGKTDSKFEITREMARRMTKM